MTTLDTAVFDDVRAELESARGKYPRWPGDMVHAAAIASEESGEVVKSVNSYYWQQGDDTLDDIRHEAIQAIAMWVRFLTETPALCKRLPTRDTVDLAAEAALDLEYTFLDFAGALR